MGRILFLDASFEKPFIIYDETLIELKSSDEMAEVVAALGVFDVVAAGEGPGSYTGMRVALSLASALSLSWQVPLVTVSALYGFIPEKEGSFSVMLDARSGGVYQLLGKKEQTVIYEGKPIKTSIEDVILPDFVLSPHVAVLQKRLLGNTRWIEMMPQPRLLQERIKEKIAQGAYSLTGQAELLYLGRTL